MGLGLDVGLGRLPQERVGELRQLRREVPADDVAQQRPQVLLDLGARAPPRPPRAARPRPPTARARSRARSARSRRPARAAVRTGRRSARRGVRCAVPRARAATRSASRWSVRPESGSSRSQPSSKRSSTQASSPSVGRLRAISSTNARSSPSCGLVDHERPVAEPGARDRQRPPCLPLAANPGERRERDPRRVEAQRGLQVAQAGSATSSSPSGPAPGTSATTVAGPVGSPPRRVGRQRLEPVERHEPHPLDELDLRPMRTRSREAARPPRARCGPGSSPDELAEHGLEPLGIEIELAGIAVEDAVREAAQAVLGDRHARALLERVGVRRTHRARRERRARSAPGQRSEGASGTPSGARGTGRRAAGSSTDRRPRMISKGTSSPARTAARSVAAASVAKPWRAAWSWPVAIPPDSSTRARILHRAAGVAEFGYATSSANTGARDTSSQSQRRPYSRMLSMIGSRSIPFCVSEYSTRGGTSG